MNTNNVLTPESVGFHNFLENTPGADTLPRLCYETKSVYRDDQCLVSLQESQNTKSTPQLPTFNIWMMGWLLRVVAQQNHAAQLN